MEQKEKQTLAATAGVVAGAIVWYVWTERRERKKRRLIAEITDAKIAELQEVTRECIEEYEKDTNALGAAWKTVLDKHDRGEYNDNPDPNCMVEDVKFYKQVLRED